MELFGAAFFLLDKLSLRLFPRANFMLRENVEKGAVSVLGEEGNAGLAVYWEL